MSFVRWLLFLPPGASTFADGIDLLHLLVISVTMLGAAAVGAVSLWYGVRYRRRAGARRTPPETPSSKRGEIFRIVAIFALFTVFWAIGFSQYIALASPPDGAMEIQVTAKQWVWKFSYPDGKRSINVLTVPVGKPVRLNMTSRDVIHSFFVPAFRIKQDVVPGRYVSAWFQATVPGNYDIYCAEYCGVSHSRMLGTVSVLSESDYAAWLSSGGRTPPLARKDFETAGGEGEAESSDLARLGRTVAARRQCFACHTLDGQPHIGPTWRGLFGATIPLEGNRTVVADAAYLTRSMMDPLADVHAGYRAVMPTYQGVLSASEVAAIVAFIETLDVGDDTSVSGVRLPTLTDAGTFADPNPPADH